MPPKALLPPRTPTLMFPPILVLAPRHLQHISKPSGLHVQLPFAALAAPQLQLGLEGVYLGGQLSQGLQGWKESVFQFGDAWSMASVLSMISNFSTDSSIQLSFFSQNLFLAEQKWTLLVRSSIALSFAAPSFSLSWSRCLSLRQASLTTLMSPSSSYSPFRSYPPSSFYSPPCSSCCSVLSSLLDSLLSQFISGFIFYYSICNHRQHISPFLLEVSDFPSKMILNWQDQLDIAIFSCNGGMQQVFTGQNQYDHRFNSHFPYSSMTYSQPSLQQPYLPPRHIQTHIEYSTRDTNDADLYMYPPPQDRDIYSQAYEENSLLAILESENNNLKQHRNYLVGEIRKTMQRERRAKQHLYDCQDKVDSLQATIRRMKQTAQQIILRLQTQLPSSCQQFQQQLIQQLKVDFELETPLLSKPQEQGRFPSLQMGQLTHKFEVLLNEHHRSSSPLVRKECLQVAKQIRELGDGKKQKIRIDQEISQHMSLVESLDQLTQEQVQGNIFVKREAYQSGHLLQINSDISMGSITDQALWSPKNDT